MIRSLRLRLLLMTMVVSGVAVAPWDCSLAASLQLSFSVSSARAKRCVWNGSAMR